MRFALTILMIIGTSSVMADAVPFSDYKLLNTGMTEAEILYRIGPPDHETVLTDYHHFVIRKTWFYIPNKNQSSSKRWISEIRFDAFGHVVNLKRYRP